MNKLRMSIATASLLLGIGGPMIANTYIDNDGDEAIGRTDASKYEEMQAALEMVQRADILIAEDFVITEENIFETGDIRGEKLEDTGEGIYLEKSEVEAFDLKLELGDVVRVTWKANDYWNNEWHEFENIIVTEKGAFEVETIE